MAIMAVAIFNTNIALIGLSQESSQKLSQWWRDQLKRTNNKKVMIDLATQLWKVTFSHYKNPILKRQTFFLWELTHFQRIQPVPDDLSILAHTVSIYYLVDSTKFVKVSSYFW